MEIQTNLYRLCRHRHRQILNTINICEIFPTLLRVVQGEHHDLDRLVEHQQDLSQISQRKSLTYTYRIDKGLPHLNLYARGHVQEMMTTVISLEAEDVEGVTLNDRLMVHAQEMMTIMMTTDQIAHVQLRFVRDPDLVMMTRLQRDLDLRGPDLEIVIMPIDVLFILMV